MGQVISLAERRAERAQEREHGGAGQSAFFFALDCPVSYLVAERVERDLGEIAWMPTLAMATGTAPMGERLVRARREAVGHRLPLIEPDNFPFDARPVTRAAAFAAQQGAGGAFALAAMRMAFAGGFDLEDADVIAEAAAAAGVSVDGALAASADADGDAGLELTARGLAGRGILETPALRTAEGWRSGFAALGSSPVASAPRQMLGLPGPRR